MQSRVRSLPCWGKAVAIPNLDRKVGPLHLGMLSSYKRSLTPIATEGFMTEEKDQLIMSMD